MTPVAALLAALMLAAGADVASDEEVVFFPTAAWRVDGDTAWEIPVAGWIFELEERALLLDLFHRALDPPEAEDTPESRERFRARARHVLADNERAKRPRIRVGTHAWRLGPSGKDGRFDATVRLSDADVAALPAAERPSGGRLRFQVVLPGDDARAFEGEALLVGPRGLSVVSDIDDTLKITEVRDRDALILNSFFRPFREVPGIAALYRHWAAKRGARFHYLSGSPGQLWPALAPFMAAAGFPPGSVHLKRIRLVDRTVKQLFAGSRDHKLGHLRTLVARYPQRRFVLVGDSGEEDPEIYATVAREHPGRIAAVFIRDVTGEPADAPRYREAFNGIPAARWRVFTDPAALRDAVPR